MVMPIMPNGMGEITPMFGVIVLSFWLINKNELLPFYSVFILGMFFDVFLGSMLGLGIFSAVIIKFLLNKLLANKSRVNFLQIFIYTIISIVIWTLTVSFPILIFNFNSFDFTPVVFQFLSSVTLAPLLITFMNYFLKKMARYSYD